MTTSYSQLQLRSNFRRKRMVCACHTNLGLSTLLFMARTNHMLHTECSNGAAIDCKRSSRLTEFLNAIAIHCIYISRAPLDMTRERLASLANYRPGIGNGTNSTGNPCYEVNARALKSNNYYRTYSDNVQYIQCMLLVMSWTLLPLLIHQSRRLLHNNYSYYTI